MGETLTIVEAAWLAGFIDGEGSIIVRFHKPGLKYILASLYIYNTDLPTLKSIKKHSGGSVSINNRGTKKHKQGYKLAWYGSSAWKVLAEVLPYLRLKHRQATLAIELFKLQSKSTKNAIHNPKRQIQLVDMCKKLNRKGPK